MLDMAGDHDCCPEEVAGALSLEEETRRHVASGKERGEDASGRGNRMCTDHSFVAVSFWQRYEHYSLSCVVEPFQ